MEKSISKFLSRLHELDVKLWLEGDRLKYSAPKGVMTAELRTELVAYKAEIIAFLQQVNADLNSPIEPIQTVSKDGNLPLSFAQERLWFLDNLGNKRGTYNMPSAQRLKGPLDITILERAVAEILRRHEALRTTFKRIRFSAVQAIAPTLAIDIPVVDLREFSPSNRDSLDAEIQRLMQAEIQCPFDLARDPLVRILLLRLDEEEHILLTVMHHIISDAWSVGVFMQELSTLYPAFASGQPSPLPELPIQYADFAHWQRQWLDSKILEHHLNYWQQRLKGKIAPLELPIDRPQSSSPTNRAASKPLAISSQLVRPLKSLSQQQKSSLFIVLLTAFKVLLHCYTSQEDMLVCFPISGRNRTETEGLIGYFNNILVSRTDLSGDPSLQTLMKRVRQVVFEAYKHQDIPFQKIGELPNLVRTPLSRAMFALQNTPKRVLEIPGMQASYLEVSNSKADFDLYWILEEKGEELTGVLHYNADLFEEKTIAKLANNYQIVLEHLVANPDRSLSSLPSFPQTRSSETEVRSQPWDSLIPIKPRGSKKPLFLIHDGLGRTVLYLNLARHLDAEQPVYALRPYGCEENPVLHRRVAEMAAHYKERIYSVQPQGPYAIAGLSFGGLIAFEIARQIQAEGQRVDFVGLLDSLDIEELRRVGARTFPQELIQQNPAIHDRLPELIREYVPRVYSGKVTLFRASQGEELDQPNRERTNDLLFGWEQWATEGVEVHDVPGGHYTLLQDPHVRVLADKLTVGFQGLETLSRD